MDIDLFGLKFREFLTNREISINKAAKELGIAPSQLQNILDGKNYGVKFLFIIMNKYTDFQLDFFSNNNDVLIAKSNDTKKNTPIDYQYKELAEARLEIIQLKDEKIARLEKDLLECKQKNESFLRKPIPQATPQLEKKEPK